MVGTYQPIHDDYKYVPCADPILKILPHESLDELQDRQQYKNKLCRFKNKLLTYRIGRLLSKKKKMTFNSTDEIFDSDKYKAWLIEFGIPETKEDCLWFSHKHLNGQMRITDEEFNQVPDPENL